MLIIKNNISTTKPYFGFTYDPANSSPALTKTGVTELSDLGIFFSKIKLVLLADNLTETATIATWANPAIVAGADLTGASGQVMVKIPKFYYQELYDGAGTLTGVDLSETPKTGYALHPAFDWGGGKNYVYIGKYEAGNDAGIKLKSTSGVAPLVSQTLATFRTRAAARGAGWHQYGFWDNHLIQVLFYVYYGTWYSQSVLPGYTEASSYSDSYKRLTGRTNNLTTVNGSVDADLSGIDSDLVAAGITAGGKIANQFMWIENIFGHIWKFIDGFAADGRTTSTNKVYVTNNPSLFSSVDADILANYIDLGIELPGTSNEGCIQNLQKGFLPKTYGGSGSIYVTDYFWSYLNDASRNYLRVGLVGGPLSGGSLCGPALLYVLVGLGFALSHLGGRLCATV